MLPSRCLATPRPHLSLPSAWPPLNLLTSWFLFCNALSTLCLHPKVKAPSPWSFPDSLPQTSAYLFPLPLGALIIS